MVNGIPLFFIAVSPGPPEGITTPEGWNGWDELSRDGVTLIRAGTGGEDWNTTHVEAFGRYADTAFAHGIYSSPNLAELTVLNSPKRRTALTDFINRYKSHPGILFWKSADEPQWSKVPVKPLRAAYELMHQLDPNHPVWTTHAPRGTYADLLPYNSVGDVVATDIYPVSEPPGKHSLLPNKGLSMVGDYTSLTVALARAGGKMPFMMLQGCWSGVVYDPPRRYNKLMYPTFHQERYMVYQAIINGSRSVGFFGVGIPLTLSGRDAECGWNWTFWRAVIRPLLDEIKQGSELYPVLCAPESEYPLKHTGGKWVETMWREGSVYLYIFAAAREENAGDVTFSGLDDGEVTVLHENRTIITKDGSFTDHFEPNDVHIYRALRVIPREKPRTKDAATSSPGYWTPGEAK